MTKEKDTSVIALFNMSLLLVFTIVCLGVAFSAIRGFQDVQEERDNISELAVAMSYLNARLRQNDCSYAVRIDSSPVGDGSALVITEEIEDSEYETWIYWWAGELVESFIEKGDDRIEEASSPIAEIDGFEVTYDEPDLVKIHVWCGVGSKNKDLTFKVALRTQPIGAEEF
ncbi:MAG: DUF4860 domain-containing protein [Bacillota bacterium]